MYSVQSCPDIYIWSLKHFIENVPYRVRYLNTWSQVVVLFGHFVDHLGDEALIKDICPWRKAGMLIVSVHCVCSLLLAWGWDGISQLPHLATCWPFVAVFSHQYRHLCHWIWKPKYTLLSLKIILVIIHYHRNRKLMNAIHGKQCPRDTERCVHSFAYINEYDILQILISSFVVLLLSLSMAGAFSRFLCLL